MLNTSRIDSIRNAGLKASVAALLLAASGASMAATYDLCATSGIATMPGTGETMTVLGYGTYANSQCSAIAAPGGPVLEVEAGKPLTVTLHNGLAGLVSTGLVFQGQAMPPDLTGVAAGSDTSYTFTPQVPGTYLYQAAPLTGAEYQTAMGLYGALVVRPSGVPAPYSRTDAGVVLSNDASGKILATDAALVGSDVGASVSGAGIPPGTTIESLAGTVATLSATAQVDATISMAVSKRAGQAYAAGTEFDEESILVLSEIDPALNKSPAPGSFDLRDIAPKYFLINGKAYPDTTAITSGAGHKLLLRYVNAGVKHHSMGLLGLRQQFIAKDGSVLPTADVAVTAETLASGQTGDALVKVPAVTTDSKFALYDASLNLHNSSDPGIGGMLTFVTAGAGTATAGPAASAASVTPSPTNGSATVALSATVKFAGGTAPTAAEYFIDTQGTPGDGVAMAVSGTAVTATVPVARLATLPSGSHTFYVHGRQGGVWGSYASAVLYLDKAGPVTSALTLSPNPSNGTVAVVLGASASDVDTGGASIARVEYKIGSGTPVAMDLGTAGSPVTAATATIPGGSCTATCTVSVRSRDALGNWGDPATISLTVTKVGPVTSFGDAALQPPVLPGPYNNGSYGISSGQPVLRVRALETSVGATVIGAAGLIDACPDPTNPDASLRGFPFVPMDGAWDGATEQVSADIPLANIARRLSGPHAIYVRGRDSIGTWGDCVSTPLTIDKTAPTLNNVSLNPAAVAFGTVTVGLSFTAGDQGGAGVAGLQYWFDSATAPVAPQTLAPNATSLNVGTLQGGNHTVYFRARDAANNVSTVRSVSLTVVQAVNDARTITPNNSNTPLQASDTSNNQRVLANDLPGNGNPRFAVLVAEPVRTGGNGAGTLAISCPRSLGTPGNTVNGNTICTNGAYRATLTGVGSPFRNGLRNSKRGTFQFTYQMNRGGVLSNVATVTIRVQ